MSVEEVAKAIRSFPNGSAGGPNGHLKDLVGPTTGGGGHSLLSALASFVTLVLAGRTPPSIRPFFFGATLIALEKKDGGVRPIAVGCTLRRLAAKVASGRVLEDMAALLAPHQLGFGVKGGGGGGRNLPSIPLDSTCTISSTPEVGFQERFQLCAKRQNVVRCAGSGS